MRILYRNPKNQSLSITEVANTEYMENDKLLVFFGDEDICIRIEQKLADLLTKTLFEEGKLDLTSYGCVPYEWPDEDDDDDDEDDDDEDDDDDYSPFDGSDFVIRI